MPRGKHPLVIPLEIGCALYGVGACELVVQENRVGIVDNAQPLFPKTRAVIGFLVICGLENLVETTQPLPGRAWREQECAGTVIHIAAEHVHRCEWVITAAVTQARSVTPNDAAGFLERAIQQDQPAPDGADVRTATNRRQR